MSTYRTMDVQRRVNGTINGAVEYHCEYFVHTDDGETLAAQFTLADVIAGGLDEAKATAVVGAIEDYGADQTGNLAGVDSAAKFVELATDYEIRYRAIPASGATVKATFRLSTVKAATLGVPGADFDTVVNAVKTFGDNAAGYAP